MERVIVERVFDEPISYEELQAREEANAWCLEAYNVTYLRTYVSADSKRMICLFEAPDAESVRAANRQAGLPFDKVWTASLHGPQQ